MSPYLENPTLWPSVQSVHHRLIVAIAAELVDPMDSLRVEGLQPKGRRRQFNPLWLAWVGAHPLSLAELWPKYLRRFALEHGYRFAKQRLHWTYHR